MSPSPAGATSRPRPLAGLGKDLQVAVRRLSKDRGFTATAVLTLALATGATTAVFTLVNAVLLRPLAYRAPEQLVRIYDVQPDVPRASVSVPGCPRLGHPVPEPHRSRALRPDQQEPLRRRRAAEGLDPADERRRAPGHRPSPAPGPRVRRGRGPCRRASGGHARRALLAEAVRRPPGDRGEHPPSRWPRPHRHRGRARAAPLARRLRGLGSAAERSRPPAAGHALHERRGSSRARGDGGRGAEGPPVGGEVDRPRQPRLSAPRHPGGAVGGRASRRGAHLARCPRGGGGAGAAHRLREPGEPPARPRGGAPARGGGPDGARRRPLAGGPRAAGRGRGALGVRDRPRAPGGMGGRLGAPRGAAHPRPGAGECRGARRPGAGLLRRAVRADHRALRCPALAPARPGRPGRGPRGDAERARPPDPVAPVGAGGLRGRARPRSAARCGAGAPEHGAAPAPGPGVPTRAGSRLPRPAAPRAVPRRRGEAGDAGLVPPAAESLARGELCRRDQRPAAEREQLQRELLHRGADLRQGARAGHRVPFRLARLRRGDGDSAQGRALARGVGPGGGRAGGAGQRGSGAALLGGAVAARRADSPGRRRGPPAVAPDRRRGGGCPPRRPRREAAARDVLPARPGDLRSADLRAPEP